MGGFELGEMFESPPPTLKEGEMEILCLLVTGLVVASIIVVIAACMLSSQISQEEERREGP